MRQRFATSRPARGGNVAIVLALLLTLLLGVAAIVIDLGRARVVRYELENASEAAARAAAAQLDGTSDGLAAAREAAITLAAANKAAGRSVSIDDDDVEFGLWEDGTWSASDTASEVNAVQVRARIPTLDTFFAKVVFLQDSIPVGAYTRISAVHGGAGAVDCYIPLALPACQITRNTVDGMQNLTLQINPPGIDSVGWGRLNGTPNANWTRDQINDCEQGGSAQVGDPVGLQNGVVTSALDALVTRIHTSSTRWTTSRWGTQPTRMANSSVSAVDYGKTYEGPVLIFDGGPSYCQGSGGQFNQSKPLVGFIWGAIYDVKNTQSASSRTIKMRLDVRNDYDMGTAGGGPDYGVVVDDPPRMVR